jgi:DNA polymerase (family 10)
MTPPRASGSPVKLKSVCTSDWACRGFHPSCARTAARSKHEAALSGTLPKLVELEDIKGDLHSHTNWTDGTQTLEEMAKAARAHGYQYLALTDHSQNLAMTRGLTPERLREQRALVDRLNHKMAPFVVLLGTEMDILLDGQLDFPPEVLAELDYVSASVHTGFKQAEKIMTARMVRAISEPWVHTLNHPHGRKRIEWTSTATGCGAHTNWARASRSAPTHTR